MEIFENFYSGLAQNILQHACLVYRNHLKTNIEVGTEYLCSLTHSDVLITHHRVMCPVS